VPSIIEQIQRDALDRNVCVSDLLRRVKFAATKLGLGVVEDWVENELNGYEDHRVPEYRIVHGNPTARNPMLGWVPIVGSTEGLLSSRPITQSVASLEELVKSNKKGSAFIRYSDAILETLNRTNQTRGWLAGLEISRSALAAILDRVRTLILDWALKMEQAGVLGTEFDFNVTEKAKAQGATTTINIGNIGAFAGNLGSGNVAGDVTLRDLDLSRVGEVARQLQPHVDDLAAAGADGFALMAKLDELTIELKRPAPATPVLRGLLVDVRNAIAGAAGSLIAAGATALINQILGTGVPPVPGSI
jgi:hypothetical protein